MQREALMSPSIVSDSPRDEDADLITRFQSGDERAFEALFRRYQGCFLRLSLRFLNNASEAEDAVQEAFVDIYHGLPRFRRQASFTTWAYRIVTRKCYARCGRAGHSRLPPASLDTLRDLPSPPSLPTLDTLIVQQAMQSLPAEARLLLILKYYEQFSDDEIAQIMNLGVGQSKMRVHRAKNALKDLLMQSATTDDLNEANCLNTTGEPSKPEIAK